MCIGIPMQVLSVREGFVQAQGRGEQRELSSALIQPVLPGDWVLAFLDSAREVITPERAAEVNAMLDLLAAALSGESRSDSAGDSGATVDAALGFALPSAQSAADLKRLWGVETATTQPLT